MMFSPEIHQGTLLALIILTLVIGAALLALSRLRLRPMATGWRFLAHPSSFQRPFGPCRREADPARAGANNLRGP